MIRLFDIVSPQIIEALGWAIIHSLWQGTLIAAILAILLLVLRGNSSANRYVVASAALLVCVMMFGGTFYHYYSNPSDFALQYGQTIPETASFEESTYILSSYNTVLEEETTNEIGFWEQISILAYQNLPYIVMIWGIGMLFFSVRLVGGLAYVEFLCRRGTKPIDAKWQKMLFELQRRMQIQRNIKFMESILIQTPMVLGWLKPVILVPVGMLNGLTEKEVENIIAHELAHIRRNDYLLNLIQSIIEVILFYHPAIWWISSCIREERENCCDDWAIRTTGDPILYAKALASVAEMSLKPNLAVAFSGKRGSLMNRVKRIVGFSQKESYSMESMGTASLIFLGIVLLAISAEAKFNPFSEEENTEEIENCEADVPCEDFDAQMEEEFWSEEDSTRKRRTIIIEEDENGIQKADTITHSAGDLRIWVDNEDFEDDIEFDSVLVTQSNGQRMIIKTPRAPKRPRNTFHFAQPDGELIWIDKKDSVRVFSFEDFEDKMERWGEQFEQDMERFGEELEFHFDGLRGNTYHFETGDDDVVIIDKEVCEKLSDLKQDLKVRIKKDIQMAHEEMSKAKDEAQKARKEAKKVRKEVRKEVRHKSENMLQDLKAELMKDGIIKNTKDRLRFKIDNEGLTINGTKQDDAVYEKYKKFIAKSTGHYFNHNSSFVVETEDEKSLIRMGEKEDDVDVEDDK